MKKSVALALLTAVALPASAADAPALPPPACVAVLELTPAASSADSGKVLADLAARQLRDKGAQLLERRDITAFLQSRRLGMPKQRDAVTVSALGQTLQASAVLDGIVIEYADGTPQSDDPGNVAVEVLFRLVDSTSKRVLWEGSGRATGGSMFRFQRQPMAKVSERAVKRALSTLAFAGNPAGACPALGSTALVSTPAEQSIVAQGATEGASAPPLRIVRTFTATSGEKRSIDISEVRVLHFNTDEAEIKAGMELLIQEIAAVLRDNPDLRLVVEGHSDVDGRRTPEQTFMLSYKRAEAVYLALRKMGIDERRLFIQAAGSRSPVAPNDSKFNRTLNRRVEFKFLAGNT